VLDKLLYDKLCRYCETQERCRFDVAKKCTALKIPKAEASAYIDQLERSGFISEQRYVRLFVDSRIRRRWGSARIRAALAARGIKEGLYKSYLSQIDKEQYYDSALQLAQKKNTTIRSKTPQEHRLKLMRFLLGKGYEQDIVKRVLQEVLK
jgi:regulatory protein